MCEFFCFAPALITYQIERWNADDRIGDQKSEQKKGGQGETQEFFYGIQQNF